MQIVLVKILCSCVYTEPHISSEKKILKLLFEWTNYVMVKFLRYLKLSLACLYGNF